MTTPINDPLMPYEVQLTHADQTTNLMQIVASQRQVGSAVAHKLKKGVYLISLTYNRTQSATLTHNSPATGLLSQTVVPAGSNNVPRMSAPIKISVEADSEFLNVLAPVSTGGTGRATISVIPFETYKPA